MKRTLRTVAVLTLAGVVISSCASLNKMKKMEKNIAYKVTPEVLEAKGGQVDVKIDATIPAKYFKSDFGCYSGVEIPEWRRKSL